MTQEDFRSLAPGKDNADEFEGMFFEETGGVVIWTRQFTWGIFAECGNSIEKRLCLRRDLEWANTFEEPEAHYATEWRDIALFDEPGVHFNYRERIESLPPLDPTETNAFSGNLRITRDHIRRDAEDPLIAQRIDSYGHVMIWTQHVVASVRSVGNGERILKLPRNPMPDIHGCYNRFPSNAECLPYPRTTED